MTHTSLYLNVFKFFFENLNRNPRNNHMTNILNSQLIAKSYTNENEDINMPFTVQEVKVAIKRLKNNKSARIDGILNEFLKHCPNDMYIAITQLFNLALDTCIVPTDYNLQFTKIKDNVRILKTIVELLC